GDPGWTGRWYQCHVPRGVTTARVYDPGLNVYERNSTGVSLGLAVLPLPRPARRRLPAAHRGHAGRGPDVHLLRPPARGAGEPGDQVRHPAQPDLLHDQHTAVALG